MLKWLKNFIHGTLITLDEEGNVILGTDSSIPQAGDPHCTISQRLAKMRQGGSTTGCVGCDILTWIQNKIFRIPGDHCTQALEVDSNGVQEVTSEAKKD